MKEFEIKDIRVRVIDKDTYLYILSTVRQFNIYNRQHNKEAIASLFKVFKKDMKLNIRDIISFGKTDKIKTKILNMIINSIDIVIKNKDDSTITKAYNCFRKVDNNTPNPHGVTGYTYNGIILHEDKNSSFKCLLEQLDNPKLILIYKVKEDGNK